MYYKDFINIRERVVMDSLQRGSPYEIGKFKTPRAILGEGWCEQIEVDTDSSEWLDFLKGMFGVLCEANLTMFVNDSNYAERYVKSVFIILMDVCERAEEGILNTKLWFKEFATARHLVETYDEELLIWSDESKLVTPMSDLFRNTFFLWYQNFSKSA